MVAFLFVFLVALFVVFLLHSCFNLVSMLLRSISKFYFNSVSNSLWGQFGLREQFRGLGFSRLLNFLFAYLPIKQLSIEFGPVELVD